MSYSPFSAWNSEATMSFRNLSKALAVVSAALMTGSADAQSTTPILFNGGQYLQNFDTLQTVPGSPYPTGWNGYKIAGNTPLANGGFITDTTDPAVTTLTSNPNKGSVYNYGLPLDGTPPLDPDRALGTFASPAATAGIGSVMINNTGATIDGSLLIMSFTAEQWVTSSNANVLETWTFQYKVVPGSTTLDINELSDTGWVDVPALNMNELINGAGGSGAINGNLPENQQLITATLAGLTWQAGDRLAFRWKDNDDQSNDAGMGIDNFSLTLVPEPTTYLMCGVVLLGTGAFRRVRNRFAGSQQLPNVV